jgi:anti-sigma factor ChrR (cupin superfamily)
MGIAHHPTARLSAEYRAGDIAPGAALAVTAHISACPRCAALLQEPPMAPGAAWTPSSIPPSPVSAALPPLLRGAARGRWRRVSPGVSVAELRAVSGLGEAAYLLRATAPTQIVLPPEADILLVLAGGAQAPSGSLSPGDLVETSGAIQIDVVATGGLLALLVGDDGLYRGFLGRLLS